MPEDATAPAQLFVVLQAETDGLPDVWIISTAIDDLEDKKAFPWHLSIIVEMKDVLENGIPTKPEQLVLRDFGDALDQRLQADGNAVWMARVTWNGTRQFVYRVGDPEVANAYLSTLVSDGGPAPRPLAYEMEEDPDWGYAEPYLENLRHAR